MPEGVTAGAALASVAVRLATAGVPTPQVDAGLLVRHVLGWSATRLVTGGATPLPADAVDTLDALVARRVAREPLQLLLGTVGFRHVELEVRTGVFVPRPETEVLAGEALARLPAGGLALEPCTGTGAIACALAAEGDGVRVIATDLSPAAVALAGANAGRLHLDVTVLLGDLLAPVPRELRGTADVLVANPPYLAERELAGLEPEVRDHDPVAALVAGPTGNETAARLLAEGPGWLRPGGWLLLEVDRARAATTAALARAAGLIEVAVVADLTGADRIVAGRRPS